MAGLPPVTGTEEMSSCRKGWMGCRIFPNVIAGNLPKVRLLLRASFAGLAVRGLRVVGKVVESVVLVVFIGPASYTKH